MAELLQIVSNLQNCEATAALTSVGNPGEALFPQRFKIESGGKQIGTLDAAHKQVKLSGPSNGFNVETSQVTRRFTVKNLRNGDHWEETIACGQTKYIEDAHRIDDALMVNTLGTLLMGGAVLFLGVGSLRLIRRISLPSIRLPRRQSSISEPQPIPLGVPLAQTD